MAEVINLNRFRKARTREDEARQADENRVRFGRTKAEKQQDQAEADRSAKDLDGKKVD
ncbi:MAG TPA: DUF4169 family protein [Patescibacteria group bacterium]|nr:DUF4169 family protein [Patescibacteria group bacterium]